MSPFSEEPIVRSVPVNGIEVNVATVGAGPAILLLHGWPHTWRLWHAVMPVLARHHRVIAPDLRGLGGSTRARDGYDSETLADDAAALLEALGVDRATVVGIDLGVQIAWMLAMRHPGRVDRLAVMEGLLGTLPGAERFLAKGPPWWFGFHAVPGLAETVLDGHEDAYIDWFLETGTKDRRGIDEATRRAFLDAYAGPEAMACGFAHYRAFPTNARQIAAVAAGAKAGLPILALAGGVVGDALAGQLGPISERLVMRTIPDCAHLVPLENPRALVDALQGWMASTPGAFPAERPRSGG